jgi:hypothetical protein
MALLNPVSQVDQAFNDTLIRKAEDSAFDSLAEMYGVPRVEPFKIKYWRKGLQHVALGPRGAPGSTFGFVREVLREWDKSYQIQIQKGAGLDQRITWVAGGPLAGFEFKDLFRFWEIDGKVYLSNGKTAAGASPWAWIELSPFSGAHWNSCSWSLDLTLVTGIPVNKTAIRLPFTCKAYGAQYKLYVDVPEALAPATFLQYDYAWAIQYENTAPIPALAPQYWYPSTVEHLGDVEALQFPYTGYFPVTADPLDQSKWTVDQGATLSRIDFFSDLDGAPAPARGGNYVATLRVNNAPTALTVTLGAAATHAFTNANVAVSAGDVLSIQIASAAGTAAPLVGPRIQVHATRPVGQPIGGQLLNDAAVSGDQTAGPHPLYLSGSTFESLRVTLELLLAAGVIPEVIPFDFKQPW